MRVLFVTENDPIYIYDFFKTLIKHHNKSKFEIVGVTILNAFNESLLNTGIRILKLYNIKFYKILFKFLLVKLKKQSISNLLLNNGYSVIPSESVTLLVSVSPNFISFSKTSNLVCNNVINA